MVSALTLPWLPSMMDYNQQNIIKPFLSKFIRLVFITATESKIDGLFLFFYCHQAQLLTWMMATVFLICLLASTLTPWWMTFQSRKDFLKRSQQRLLIFQHLSINGFMMCEDYSRLLTMLMPSMTGSWQPLHFYVLLLQTAEPQGVLEHSLRVFPQCLHFSFLLLCQLTMLYPLDFMPCFRVSQVAPQRFLNTLSRGFYLGCPSCHFVSICPLHVPLSAIAFLAHGLISLDELVSSIGSQPLRGNC